MDTVTMTTKDLHRDMPRFIATLKQGKAVRLTYRGKEVALIPPKHRARPRPGSPEAVRRGLKALEKLQVPDHVRNDPRSIKEQIAEMRMRDMGKWDS